MFGIGFWELILIFVVALIIFGPEKLPKIAASLGKAYYEFRKTFEEVKFDIENETQDIRNLDLELEEPGKEEAATENSSKEEGKGEVEKKETDQEEEAAQAEETQQEAESEQLNNTSFTQSTESQDGKEEK